MTDDMEKKDLLLFAVADQVFALPGTAVDVVMAPQPVTRLPFVPDYVDGLVNAGEHVMPQLALRRLLFPGDSAAASERGELLIVGMGHAPCAVHVSRVMGRIQVEPERIRPLQSADQDMSTLFTARCEHEGEVLLVLEPALLSALLSPREAADGQRGMLGRLQADANAAQRQDDMACVVVSVAGERYALALGDVLEILDLPPATPLPGAPALIEGMALVRDEVLLVLPLARLLGGAEVAAGTRHVLVIERGPARYGLRVDAVEGIESFRTSACRLIEDEASEVAGVFVHAGAVVGLLTPLRLLSPAREALVRAFVPDGRRDQVNVPVATRAVLQVAIGGEDYALPLESVRRVVPYAPPELLDTADGALISAIASIDGAIVPVLDLASHLALEQDGRPAVWVIVGVDDREWAIPVTRACDILDIPVTAIEALDGRQNSFVAGLATVERRLISLISLAPLTAATALPGAIS